MSSELDFSQILPRLQKSKFRMRFKLDQKDLAYIEKNGLEKIKAHAADFIEKRLAPENPLNDGRQTPFKGHPVFKAQHATAICCRGCIYKWYSIPKGRVLTKDECQKVIDILIDWINWQINLNSKHETRNSKQITNTKSQTRNV